MNLIRSLSLLALCGTASARLAGLSEEANGAELGDRSLSGLYAFRGAVGSHLGGDLCIFDCDGKGVCEGQVRLNLPNPPVAPERITFIGRLDATYTMGADGFGEMSLQLFGDQPQAGPPFPVRLLVTERQGSKASRLSGEFEVPSAFVANALTRFEMTARRSGGFDNSSLDGVYALTMLEGSNEASATGVFTFDAEGGLTGIIKNNDPNLNDGGASRVLSDHPVRGTYSVDDDGFLTMTITNTVTNNTDELTLLVFEATGTRADIVLGGFDEDSTYGLVTADFSYVGQARSITKTE